jgi:16S rRNA (cytosine967-C5)-methyltransferase
MAAAMWAAWLATDTPEASGIRAEAAAGLPPCPPDAAGRARIMGADPDAMGPPWLAAECPAALSSPLCDTLLGRAPLWVRLQGDGEPQVPPEFAQLGWECTRSPLVAGALRLPQGAAVESTQAHRSGLVEVQDAGSQRVLLEARVPGPGRWLDACAGAGGKSLQLAFLLGREGRVVARDPRPEALARLRERARRAGLSGRITTGAGEEGPFDGVLVDAPCTGSGTWRRSPHLRWTTTPESIAAKARLQLRLLRENAPAVRPGGLLVYSTCSLCRSENERVVSAFLQAEGGFRAATPGRMLYPEEHDGDGFFVATFTRG